MDWTNINLSSGYERDQNIIEPLNFDTLLLEVHCNIKEINKKTVMAQFEEDLKSRITSAREVMESNIDNIVRQAQKERAE